MFGVVPRVLWQKVAPPDEQNRIRLGLNCLLIRTGRQSLLVDTGCGKVFSEKEERIFGFGRETSVIEELEKLGTHAGEIGYVIHTHLHFDHCGGNTHNIEDRLVPSFPNAKHVVRREEFEAATHANERNRASYREENWIPLVEHDQLMLIESDQEIIPGVHCLFTPGHTEGHQSILVESEGKGLLFMGDLCPTAAHVPLPWIMSYDLYPVTTLETRKRLYREALDKEWTLMFEHDANRPFGKLTEEGGVYRVGE